MTPHSVVASAAAIACVALAAFVLPGGDRRRLVRASFAVGMLALAANMVFEALRPDAATVLEMLRWKRRELWAECLVPGAWLLFVLVYARSNRGEILRRWIAVCVASAALPMLTLGLLGGRVFDVPEEALLATSIFLPLGWAGKLLYVVRLLTDVAILWNLESTLRATTGTKRWRVKFVILGLGSLFAYDLYFVSQTLLYRSVNWELAAMRPWVVLAAAALVAVALVRNRLLDSEIYLSRSLLYNSVTLLAASAYLIGVGLLANAIHWFGGTTVLPLGAFFVFLALLGLTALLLSDQYRLALRRFINVNFYSHAYDYRKEWLALTRSTASILDLGELCRVVCRRIADTLSVHSVTIWIYEAEARRVSFGASTLLAKGEEESPESALLALVDALPPSDEPVCIDDPNDAEVARAIAAHAEFYHRTQARWVVPLVSAGTVVGVIAMSDRVGEVPFNLEDFDLVRTIGDQTASGIIGLQLSRRVVESKESEAFQQLSAFFVHDMKNLASMLSLTVQNLPSNYDNPEFRDDALRVMARGVEKLNAMCSKLGTLSAEPQLERREVDLNDAIIEALDEIEPSLHLPLKRHLAPEAGRLKIDADEMQKVLTNLVLNAKDAIESGGGQGEIRVSSRGEASYALVSVSDDGCGMSADFVDGSLFRPFQTTKSKGLGIGVYQCSKIVKAHGGRIWVESALGSGTTFWIQLPRGVDLGGESR